MPRGNSRDEQRFRFRSTRLWFRCFFRFGVVLIWGLMATGLILRFTVRDRFHPWSLVYYITPIPALPVWALIAGLAWGHHNKTKSALSRVPIGRLSLICVLVFASWTACSEFVFRADPIRPQDFRVVFWNVARAQVGIKRIATELRAWNSPLIALVEADKDYKLIVAHWGAELPSHRVAGTHFGGLVAVQGEILSQQQHQLSFGGWCEQFDLQLDEQKLTLLLVDISSQLSLSRRGPLQSLATLAGDLADRPLMIVGDFNTPDDSVWFEPLRRHCRQGFREKGGGYAATWPVPLPVLTLDQIWVNKFFDVSRCQNGWTTSSDHRPVTASVSLRQPD
jgi:vancomycin resistance protein VanJ